jgi:hypothetical protein
MVNSVAWRVCVCVYTVKAMERESNLHTHLFAYCGKQEEKTSNNNNNNRNRRDRLSGGIPPFLSFHSHFFLSFFSCFFFIFLFFHLDLQDRESCGTTHTAHTRHRTARAARALSVFLFLFLFFLHFFVLSLGFTRSRKLRDDTHSTHTSPHGACSTSVFSVSLSFFFFSCIIDDRKKEIKVPGMNNNMWRKKEKLYYRNSRSVFVRL